jgi:hypothetical protein
MEYTRVGGLCTLFEEPQVLKKNLGLSWLGGFWFHTYINGIWNLVSGLVLLLLLLKKEKEKRISHFDFSSQNQTQSQFSLVCPRASPPQNSNSIYYVSLASYICVQLQNISPAWTA